MKKFLLSAFAVAAFTLSGALNAQAVTLHVHNESDPASLDPHKVSGDWENRIVGDMFEGLLTEDVDAKPVPGQAKSWEISDDGLTYTFHLRDGIKWSDGAPVTADDFVFAFRRIMDPATASSYAYLQYPIKNAEPINSGEVKDLTQLGVEAVDETTLKITLESPTPYFLGALTHYTAYPVPKHVVEDKGADWIKIENIVTNGPYKAIEWVPGSHVKTEKNPEYYDFDNLKIDNVVFYVLEDASAALKRYRAGEFDILTEFPSDQYQWLQENHPGEARVAPFAGLYYYVMNSSKPPLDDARIRQALSMAINREVIGPQILGTGEPAAYSWVPPGMNNYVDTPYNAEWADLDYSAKVEKAKELIAEAGYGPDKPLEIQLRYNTNENHKRIAVAISAMWKVLGVNITLFNAETKVHYAELKKGQLEIARAGWLADYNDPVNLLQLLRSDIGDNYGRWKSEEFDALLAEAKTTQDLKARAELLYKAEKVAIDDSAAAPIYYYLSRNVVSPKISGFNSNTFDIHRTRWMSKSE
ncbi:MAG: peptide ABC transporter substrate-binding protein [Hyphomicrobiales bacterium]|nr:peptide ABC transporter substrate-binding protein [Hyphomicrobiales bacterium]